jgi:hypothetical protein
LRCYLLVVVAYKWVEVGQVVLVACLLDLVVCRVADGDAVGDEVPFSVC